MTSSETKTESKSSMSTHVPEARTAQAGDGETLLPERLPGMPLWAVFGLLMLAGWMGILHINRWHFGPPVFFLWTGWLAVLLTARFLWQAGMSAAFDTGVDDDGDFWQPVGKHDELQREKQSLLKAIKEMEFDHQMGKTSAEDFRELTRFYRARAIEVIKALEHSDSGKAELTVAERIEQEVSARLAVESKTKAKPIKTSKGKAAKGKKTAKPDRSPDKSPDRSTDADTTAAEADSTAEATESAAVDSKAEAEVKQ